MGLFIVRCERRVVIEARRYEVKNILRVCCQKLNKFTVKVTNSPRCQYRFFLAVKKQNLLAVKTDSLAVKIFFLAAKKFPSLSKRIPSPLKYFFLAVKKIPHDVKKKKNCFVTVVKKRPLAVKTDYLAVTTFFLSM